MEAEPSLSRARTLLAVAAALSAALLLSHAARGNWAADFWEHASVVRELAAHPASPSHPQLDLPAPSAYFSPYHLLAGLASRASGFPPIGTLVLFGLGNLVLLGWALLAFARRFCSNDRPVWTAALHAAFLLMLWGADPWSWSAFLHLRVIGRTLPYPSTFSIALALVAAVEFSRYLEDPAPRRLVFSTFLWTTILLCHPPTALFCGALGVGIFLAALRSATLPALGGAVAAAAVGLALAFLWPLYPFMRLVDGSQASLWDAGSKVLFQSVLSRCWPAFLLGGWGLWRRRHHGSVDSIAASAALLLALYAYAVLYHGGWGRVIAYLMLLLQFAAADTLVAAAPRPLGRAWSAAALGAAALGLLNLAPSAAGGVLKDDPRTLDPGFWSEFPRLVGPKDIVLAQTPLEESLPAFSGRVVAYRKSNYFVPDFTDRRDAVTAFFKPGATCASQTWAAKRWGARFLAWDRTAVPEGMAARWRSWGAAGYEGPQLVLIGPLTELHCPPEPPTVPKGQPAR